MFRKDVNVTPEVIKIKVGMPGVTIKVESNNFMASRKDICHVLLEKGNLDEKDILEFLLSIHIVLEVGINTFFRLLYGTYSSLEHTKMTNLIDEVGFIEKTKFFLSSSRFVFLDGNDRIGAEKYAEELLKELKLFSNVRNLIMHGHSISEFSQGASKRKSKLKSKLNENFMKEQIEKFKKIVERFNYFIERLDIGVNREQIQQFQRSFMNSDFLF